MFFYNYRLQKKFLATGQFVVDADNALLVEDIHGSDARLTNDERLNLEVVLGAYRSFRGRRRNRIAYVSMPITTGKRLYDILERENVTSAEDLSQKLGKDALWNLVIQPNIREGITFADRLGLRHDDLLFIAPSVFEAKKWRWSEAAYMSLWYRVLGELAGSHFLMDGWEYSIGGVKEVLFSAFMQWGIISPLPRNYFLRQRDPTDELGAEEIQELWAMRSIRIFDSAGNELRLDVAFDKVVSAIERLKKSKLPYSRLSRLAESLMQVPRFSRNHKPYNPFTETYHAACGRFRQLHDMPWVIPWPCPR